MLRAPRASAHTPGFGSPNEHSVAHLLRVARRACARAADTSASVLARTYATSTDGRSVWPPTCARFSYTPIARACGRHGIARRRLTSFRLQRTYGETAREQHARPSRSRTVPYCLVSALTRIRRDSARIARATVAGSRGANQCSVVSSPHAYDPCMTASEVSTYWLNHKPQE